MVSACPAVVARGGCCKCGRIGGRGGGEFGGFLNFCGPSVKIELHLSLKILRWNYGFAGFLD